MIKKINTKNLDKIPKIEYFIYKNRQKVKKMKSQINQMSIVRNKKIKTIKNMGISKY